MTGRTETSVHSDADMLRQRRLSQAKEITGLAGLQSYAQIAVGLSLYLYGHVSTPGYLSILLTLPYLLLICALARRAGTLGSGVRSRVLKMAGALILLLDGLAVFFALHAIASEVMPEWSGGWTAAALALAVGVALGIPGAGASLPRLSRLIQWAAALMLGFCMVCALPYGSAAHFFPLLGYGPGSILRGGLWMCGCVSGGVWPMLMSSDEPEETPLLREGRVLLPPLLAALAAGIVTMLFSVWLMPVYFMARQARLGWRLLVLTNMTPSVPAWSMNVVGLLLLFLLALAASVRQAALLLTPAARSSPVSPWLTAGILGMMALLCACAPGEIERLLLWAGPLRAAVTLILLLLLARRTSGAMSGKERSST